MADWETVDDIEIIAPGTPAQGQVVESTSSITITFGATGDGKQQHALDSTKIYELRGTCLGNNTTFVIEGLPNGSTTDCFAYATSGDGQSTVADLPQTGLFIYGHGSGSVGITASFRALFFPQANLNRGWLCHSGGRELSGGAGDGRNQSTAGTWNSSDALLSFGVRFPFGVAANSRVSLHEITRTT